MARVSIAAVAFVALWLVATPRTGQAESAFQITADNRAVLMQKDVGDQRWAVLFRGARAYGNVYFPDGSPPAFVSCNVDFDPSGGAVLACGGADACNEPGCPPYVPLGETVLPASFFRCSAGDPHPISGMFALNCPPETAASADAAPAGNAASGSGLRATHDGAYTMFQKDVGGERWSVFYQDASRTLFGSVFHAEGPAVFLACSGVEENDEEVTYECFAADTCSGTCTSESYESIGTVTLPSTFFDAPPDEILLAADVLSEAIDVATNGTDFYVTYSDGSGKLQRVAHGEEPLDVTEPFCDFPPPDFPPSFPPLVETAPPAIAYLQDRFRLFWPMRSASFFADMGRTFDPVDGLADCVETRGSRLRVGVQTCGSEVVPPLLAVPFLGEVVLASKVDARCVPGTFLSVNAQTPWSLPPTEGDVKIPPIAFGAPTLTAHRGSALLAWWGYQLDETTRLHASIRSLDDPVDLRFDDTASTFEEGDTVPPLDSAALDGAFLLAWIDDGRIYTLRLSLGGEELGRQTLEPLDELDPSDDQNLTLAATDSRYLLAWSQPVNESRLDLYGALLDASGAPLGPPTVLAENVTGRPVAAASKDSLVVAYLRPMNDGTMQLWARPVGEF